MALKVQFGNGGAATVADLRSVLDQQAYNLLNGPEAEENFQFGTTLSSSVTTVPAVGGSGPAGKVDISYDDQSNSFRFDVSSAWNTVKNAYAQSNDSENVSFKDIVHVDVDLGGTGNSNVEVLNVKRGSVSTGDGNDSVHVSLLSNDSGWVNAFNINTGKGDDHIVVSAGQNLSSIGGIANASAINSGNGVTNGSATDVVINAGEGNDLVDLSGVSLKSSLVTGGKGIDTFLASGGKDTFVFALGDMQKTLATDTILGFELGSDKLRLNGTSRSDWTLTELDGDTILSYNVSSSSHYKEKIVVVGVDLSVNNSWFEALA